MGVCADQAMRKIRLSPASEVSGPFEVLANGSLRLGGEIGLGEERRLFLDDLKRR